MPSIKESAIWLVLKAKDTLSGTVRRSAESLETLKSEASELKQKLGTLEKQSKLLSAFQKQTTAVRDAGKAYREAEVNVELLASYESGETSARQMARTGQNAVNSMTLLNEQDLDRLSSSIEQAKSGMQSLNDSARSPLDNLQNELDPLQGKNEQIEKR